MPSWKPTGFTHRLVPGLWILLQGGKGVGGKAPLISPFFKKMIQTFVASLAFADKNTF